MKKISPVTNFKVRVSHFIHKSPNRVIPIPEKWEKIVDTSTPPCGGHFVWGKFQPKWYVLLTMVVRLYTIHERKFIILYVHRRVVFYSKFILLSAPYSFARISLSIWYHCIVWTNTKHCSLWDRWGDQLTLLICTLITADLLCMAWKPRIDNFCTNKLNEPKRSYISSRISRVNFILVHLSKFVYAIYSKSNPYLCSIHQYLNYDTILNR